MSGAVGDAMLPPEFADLEPWAPEWCLGPERDRYLKRLDSTMEEMQAFYDAIHPRAPAAIEYLDRFPLDGLPPDAMNLLHLVYTLFTISMSVEVWFQPRTVDAGTHIFFRHIEPVP